VETNIPQKKGLVKCFVQNAKAIIIILILI